MQQHQPSLPQRQQQQQQQPQQRPQQHRRAASKDHPQSRHQTPPPPPYLRILFPRHIQQREPVPQLLKAPHPDLDAEAYHFLALLVKDFINTWYSSFSSDPELVAAIVNVVHQIARELEKRSQQVDWVALLLQEVPEVLKAHYSDYRQAAQKFDTAFAPNQSIESIFHGLQPHFALRDNEESEKEYLRQLADEILKALLPKVEYQSDCVRWLVREIMCCLILRSVVEILTEPDMINYIVNTLLASFEPTDKEYEDFLQKGAEDIIRLKEHDKLSSFLSGMHSTPSSSTRGKLIHRSSTPNIKTTDEMVDLLQDAQASVLEPSPSDRHHPPPRLSHAKTSPFLSRPERHDNILTQRLAGAETRGVHSPPPGKSTSGGSNNGNSRISVSPQYIPPEEAPLPIPVNEFSNIGQKLQYPDSRISNTSKSTAQSGISTAKQQHGRNTSARNSNVWPAWIWNQAVWTVTVAPAEYTSYMIKNVLIPFGAMLVAFLHFMTALPNRISQVSQSLAWIYSEIEAPAHVELEAGVFGLLNEVFYLEQRNPVIWRQWEIMGWPLVRTLGGGAIDRLLAHGVHWIFAEKQLVTYIQAGRRALWPDPNSSPPRPRGVNEMEKARKEAELRILRTIPAHLRDVFFGKQGIHHLQAAQDALEPFQNKICNKHLIYIALDLLLSKVVPEIYPDQ
ncbi:hypothetical protein EMPS_06543 [Entomortierella parvispora]|uniref:PXA domain-containing protein n=1 Tax=Entomortierella parvispora TaxID=205924 RepID=A0A9P3LXU4_9FUNG|nr:hypothetical protein EMPS_06543 [Entomortierella parvispora]